jgi:citrate lyase subunit beta/citryl-CoA lyase
MTWFTFLERTRGLEDGVLRLMAWIESPGALAVVESICGASRRLVGVSLGAEDFTAGLGVQRTCASRELEYPRARIASAAAAVGLLALDGPEPDFRDAELFEVQAEHARGLGFRGKFCIHPNQVPLANRVFTPTEEERAWARDVVAAFEAGEPSPCGGHD